MIMVLSKAGVVIGGDIGPLHMAASFNVNTVTLMNPTSVEKFAPLNTKGIVLTADYDCKDCHKVKCPRGFVVWHTFPLRMFIKLLVVCYSK